MSALNRGDEDKEPTTASDLIDVPPPEGPPLDDFSYLNGNENDDNNRVTDTHDTDSNGQTGDGGGSETFENDDGSSNLQHFSLPRVSMRTSPTANHNGDDDDGEEPVGPPPGGDHLPTHEEDDDEDDGQPGVPEGLFKLGQPYRPPTTFSNASRSGSRVNSRISSSNSNKTDSRVNSRIDSRVDSRSNANGRSDRISSSHSNNGGGSGSNSGGGGDATNGHDRNNGGGGDEGSSDDIVGGASVRTDGGGAGRNDGGSTLHGVPRHEKRQTYPLAVSGVDYVGYNFDPTVRAYFRNTAICALFFSIACILWLALEL